MKKTAGAIDKVSGKGVRIGVVVGRFNADISGKLLEGCLKVLGEKGVLEKNITVAWVPGAFEIPLMLQKLARTKKYDALVSLGAVIRGETPHFDYVCDGVTSGAMRVMLDESLPVVFGVLTTDNVDQAIDRIGGRHGHKGEEAALVALEMIEHAKKVKRGR